MTPTTTIDALPSNQSTPSRGRAVRNEPGEQTTTFAQAFDLSVQALAEASPVAAAGGAPGERAELARPEDEAVDPTLLLLAGLQASGPTSSNAPVARGTEAQAQLAAAAGTQPLVTGASQQQAGRAPALPAPQVPLPAPLDPAGPAGMETEPAQALALKSPLRQVGGGVPRGASALPSGAGEIHGDGRASARHGHQPPLEPRPVQELVERSMNAEWLRTAAAQPQASVTMARPDGGAPAPTPPQAAPFAAADAQLRAALAATPAGGPPPGVSGPTFGGTRQSGGAEAAGAAAGAFAAPPLSVNMEPRLADASVPVDAIESGPASGALAAVGSSPAESASGAASTLAAPVQGVAPPLVPHHAAPGAVSAASAPHVAPPVGSELWGPALAQHLAKLAPGREVELSLNPEQLGPLKVTLTLADSRAQVAFTSDHAAVRQALEAALPQLRASFADSGLSLGQATVGHGSGSPTGEARSDLGQDRSQGQPERRPQRDPADVAAPGRRAASPMRAGGIDTFA